MKMVATCLVLLILVTSSGGVMAQAQENIILPKILSSDDKTLSQLLMQRRSVREFQNVPLSLDDLGQLLWAALSGQVLAHSGR